MKDILQSCHPNVRKGSVASINWIGCIALAEQMQGFTKVRNLVTPEVSESASHAYLVKQLASIKVNAAANHQLHQRSCQLRAAEAYIHKSRVLKSNGFDV